MRKEEIRILKKSFSGVEYLFMDEKDDETYLPYIHYIKLSDGKKLIVPYFDNHEDTKSPYKDLINWCKDHYIDKVHLYRIRKEEEVFWKTVIIKKEWKEKTSHELILEDISGYLAITHNGGNWRTWIFKSSNIKRFEKIEKTLKPFMYRNYPHEGTKKMTLKKMVKLVKEALK